MATYRITSDKTELPKGSRVYVIPAQPQPGQLVMIKGGHVGRWLPNIAGHNWLRQPGRFIAGIETDPLIVLGVVILVEDPPKEITNLSTSEYVAALLSAQEVKG